MTIRRFHLGPLETNCYVVHQDKTAFVVDPGGDPRIVLDYLNEHGLTLSHILITHTHFDHLYGNAALTAATGAPILIPAHDLENLSMDLGMGGRYGLPQVPKYDYELLHTGVQSFGGIEVHVLATPGHSPGGLSFYIPSEKAVIVGDTLFYRSVGRTDFPNGDTDQLLQSIQTVLFTLPDETVVYAGHGSKSSIGDEKRNNPYAGAFVSR